MPPCVSTTGTPLSGRSLLDVGRLAGKFAFHPGCHTGELSDGTIPNDDTKTHVQCCRLGVGFANGCAEDEIVLGEILSVTDHVRISIGQAQLPDAECYSSLCNLQ